MVETSGSGEKDTSKVETPKVEPLPLSEEQKLVNSQWIAASALMSLGALRAVQDTIEGSKRKDLNRISAAAREINGLRAKMTKSILGFLLNTILVNSSQEFRENLVFSAISKIPEDVEMQREGESAFQSLESKDFDPESVSAARNEVETFMFLVVLGFVVDKGTNDQVFFGFDAVSDFMSFRLLLWPMSSSSLSQGLISELWTFSLLEHTFSLL
jgi:hypothetical protein